MATRTLFLAIAPATLLMAECHGDSAWARSLHVEGTAGYLSEWELSADVARTPAAASREEFSGPLTLKHVGLCSIGGPQEKTGKIEFYISKSAWSSEIHATLFVDGTQCSYSGALEGGSGGFMDCSDGNGVPLKLLLK
jgi:hypothetical protein